jgi:hypothetical protein
MAYPKNEFSEQVYLGNKGSMVDKGIYYYIKKINASGFETIASCSGLKSDHYGRKERAYLDIMCPENKVDAKGLLLQEDIFNVPKQNILDKEWADNMVQVGMNSGWLAEVSTYMMVVPTISYRLPVTKSIGTDLAIENNLRIVVANKEIKANMHGCGTSEAFLKAVDKRNAIKEELFSKHDTAWSDEEIKQRWERLTTALSKTNPKTGKMK